jgi:hypothetical protein
MDVKHITSEMKQAAKEMTATVEVLYMQESPNGLPPREVIQLTYATAKTVKKAKDEVFEALRMAEFLTNELRMNGELRKDDMRNIKRIHSQMQSAIKKHKSS